MQVEACRSMPQHKKFFRGTALACPRPLGPALCVPSWEGEREVLRGDLWRDLVPFIWSSGGFHGSPTVSKCHVADAGAAVFSDRGALSSLPLDIGSAPTAFCGCAPAAVGCQGEGPVLLSTRKSFVFCSLHSAAGTYIDEDSVNSMEARTIGDSDYYIYDVYADYGTLPPHGLAAATTKGEVLLLFIVSATDKQWGKAEGQLRAMIDSFRNDAEGRKA